MVPSCSAVNGPVFGVGSPLGAVVVDSLGAVVEEFDAVLDDPPQAASSSAAMVSAVAAAVRERFI